MAQAEFGVNIHLDGESQFIGGMRKAQQATKKFTASARRQGQVWNNVAYALDDVQYGFRGVQNNLQQIAIQSGAGGPVVLALTAATIAFGFFLNKMADSEDAAWNLRSEISKLQGELTSLQGQLKSEDSLEDKLIKKWDTILGKQAKYAGFIMGLQNSADLAGFGGLFKAGRELFGLGDEDLIDPITEGNKQKDKDVAAAKEIANIKARKAANNEYYKSFISNLQHQIVLSKIFGATQTEVAQQEWEALQTIDRSKLTQDQIDSVQKRMEIAYAYLGVLDEVVVTAEKKGGEIGQAVQNGMQTALVGLGNAIGDALVGDGTFGEAVLKIIGGFMQTLGAAMIAVGVAQLEFLSNLATANPVGVIAAGVALVAAGAVVSGLARSGPGGNGASAGGGAGYTPAGSVTPQSIQGFGGDNRLVAEVSGQSLRFVLQGANDSYSARN